MTHWGLAPNGITISTNLKKYYGPWISDYNDPVPNGSGKFAEVHKYRYDQGVRAGDMSQTGQLYALLLESIADKRGYDRKDFSSRVDKLFKTLNGENYSGRYTDQAIREDLGAPQRRYCLGRSQSWQQRDYLGCGTDECGIGCTAFRRP